MWLTGTACDEECDRKRCGPLGPIVDMLSLWYVGDDCVEYLRKNSAFFSSEDSIIGKPCAEYSGAGDFGVLGSSYDESDVKVLSPSVLPRPSIDESLSLSISFILWALELNDPMLSASEL